jgi:hypothetical protein
VTLAVDDVWEVWVVSGLDLTLPRWFLCGWDGSRSILSRAGFGIDKLALSVSSDDVDLAILAVIEVAGTLSCPEEE